MTQVVYEGRSGKRNPLRTQLGYEVDGVELPVGQPTDVPDDVAQRLLSDGVKGHKFREANDDDNVEAPAPSAPDQGPATDAAPAGAAVPEPSAPEPTTTTRKRG